MKWLVGSPNNEKVTVDFLMLWTRHCKCDLIWTDVVYAREKIECKTWLMLWEKTECKTWLMLGKKTECKTWLFNEKGIKWSTMWHLVIWVCFEWVLVGVEPMWYEGV